MRVLLYHPWGRFDPACGASHAALAHRDYFRAHDWDVHCVMQQIPAWGVTAPEGESTIALNCAPNSAQDPGTEFNQLLYASERAANDRAFRTLASEPWDVFFTTDVCATPFAYALPHTTQKILAVGDSYARRAATSELVPHAVREAEYKFTFGRVEAELYRLFDHILFSTEADANAARKHSVKSACHIPLWVRATNVAPPQACEEHDITICGSEHSGDLADLEWFYRHVYLPHLRACGIRLTIAGSVADRFPVADLRITKLPSTVGVYEASRVIVAPAHSAAGPYVPVMDAMAAGRAVVTTPLGLRALNAPGDAVISIDMRTDSSGTAAVIRELLAAPGWRKALGTRAAQIPATHSRERFFAALDAVWELHTFTQRPFANAA
ncbi:glycosyltransferase [Gemmata sp. G18]|uniref:Glycosyltransferase n=1 Tax=Gemmata palustris TaxID=2822762 RepID=A0ABS5C4V6_9BACT|nr:glycosyltransferase [Gemmata palustris]MBP3961036.1 glycosyltransferase [Gemmata palustris]